MRRSRKLGFLLISYSAHHDTLYQICHPPVYVFILLMIVFGANRNETRQREHLITWTRKQQTKLAIGLGKTIISRKLSGRLVKYLLTNLFRVNNKLFLRLTLLSNFLLGLIFTQQQALPLLFWPYITFYLFQVTILLKVKGLFVFFEKSTSQITQF